MKSKQEEKTFIECASVNPNAIHFYTQPINGFSSTARHRANMVNLEDNNHNGIMSYKASKRLECVLQWMLYHAKPKQAISPKTGRKFTFLINFITLTLPAIQVHSDTEITKRCLSNFLDVFVKATGCKRYIWRAEAQANGNIHFHLTSDVFVHYDDLRRWWNNSVELLGYVSAFQFKHKHRNPNSVDVHSVKHVNRLSSYLSKYMAKNRSFACIGELRLINGKQVEVLYGSKLYKSEKGNKKTGKVIGHVLGGRIRYIQSRLWFCSRELSQCKSLKVREDEMIFSDLETIIRKCDYRTYTSEYVTSLYGEFKSVVSFLEKSRNNVQLV